MPGSKNLVAASSALIRGLSSWGKDLDKHSPNNHVFPTSPLISSIGTFSDIRCTTPYFGGAVEARSRSRSTPSEPQHAKLRFFDMGFGILEPNTTSHVPGTVLLDQQAAHSEATTGRLKHGTGKNSNIVLAPQPSEDPNDPLTWPQWRKYVVISIIFFGVIIMGAVPVSMQRNTFLGVVH